MTNAEARFNNSLRPRKPEGSLGRTAQDVHLDSHTAPELCNLYFIRYKSYKIQELFVSWCVCVVVAIYKWQELFVSWCVCVVVAIYKWQELFVSWCVCVVVAIYKWQELFVSWCVLVLWLLFVNDMCCLSVGICLFCDYCLYDRVVCQLVCVCVVFTACNWQGLFIKVLSVSFKCFFTSAFSELF